MIKMSNMFYSLESQWWWDVDL